MSIELLNKLNENPLYKKYIRHNSNWYKILNRNPNEFDNMVKQMKIDYKMRTIDKFDNIVDSIDLINKFLKVTNE